MIVLLCDEAGVVRPCVVRRRHRLLARLRAGGLDRRLARGDSPETSVLIALRAERLEQQAERRELAEDLQRAMQVTNAARGPRSQIRVCPASVRAARQEIAELVSRLTAAGPVSPQGVAEVRVLLCDGTGPLYWDGGTERRSLRVELAHALRSLDPLAGGWS